MGGRVGSFAARRKAGGNGNNTRREEGSPASAGRNTSPLSSLRPCIRIENQTFRPYQSRGSRCPCYDASSTKISEAQKKALNVGAMHRGPVNLDLAESSSQSEPVGVDRGR